MDSKKRAQLQRRRDRLNAEREGRYRAFESGTSKALLRSHLCVRIDDELAEYWRLWLTEMVMRGHSVQFETDDLDCAGWIAVARAMLAACHDPLFAVLVGSPEPLAGAICDREAVIDILEEILDREDSASVVYLTSPGALEFDVGEKAYSRHGVLYISASGSAVPVLQAHVEASACNWIRIGRDGN